jgi:hypothetical protein
MQKGTQLSQACSWGHTTPNPTQIDACDELELELI